MVFINRNAKKNGDFEKWKFFTLIPNLHWFHTNQLYKIMMRVDVRRSRKYQSSKNLRMNLQTKGRLIKNETILPNLVAPKELPVSLLLHFSVSTNFRSNSITRLAQLLRLCYLCGRSRIRFPGRLNRTQRRQRPATAATLLSTTNGAVLLWRHHPLVVTHFGVIQRV